LFAEISARFAVASPVFRKHSSANVAMKRGMRPIAHTCDESVLERLDVAIFDMTRVIGLVTDQMLPESALPDAALVVRGEQR
jgi:hypothetical protein